MKYTELKAKHREEWNAFPIAFAFNKEQLSEGLRKLGVTKEEVVGVQGGGFIRKTDEQKFFDLFLRQFEETEKHTLDDTFLLDAIKYELANHEFCVTYDPIPALDAIGVSLDDERVKNLYSIALKHYHQQ